MIGRTRYPIEDVIPAPGEEESCNRKREREIERERDVVDDIMKVQQWKLRSFNFIYSLAPPSTELTDC